MYQIHIPEKKTHTHIHTASLRQEPLYEVSNWEKTNNKTTDNKTEKVPTYRKGQQLHQTLLSVVTWCPWNHLQPAQDHWIYYFFLHQRVTLAPDLELNFNFTLNFVTEQCVIHRSFSIKSQWSNRTILEQDSDTGQMLFMMWVRVDIKHKSVWCEPSWPLSYSGSCTTYCQLSLQRKPLKKLKTAVEWCRMLGNRDSTYCFI